MDNQGNVPETVTAPPDQHVRNRHAAQAAEDLARKLAPRRHHAQAIALSAGVDLQAAVIVAVAAIVPVAVK